jgi:hypothetical protein
VIEWGHLERPARLLMLSAGGQTKHAVTERRLANLRTHPAKYSKTCGDLLVVGRLLIPVG